MKNFFAKLWAAIKKPLCYAAIILLAALFLFCAIDGIVRCFHHEVFYGIVQVLVCGAAVPSFYIAFLDLINETKRKVQ